MGPIVKYRGTLRSSVQKRLNRSICRLDCGLGYGTPKEEQVQSYSPDGANMAWRQCALLGRTLAPPGEYD